MSNKARSVFGKEMPFEEIFPAVNNITLKVTEFDNLAFPKKEDHLYNRNNINEFKVPCHNASCRNGGFYIEDILFEMVSNKESQREIRGSCEGLAGKRRCRHHFQIKITIEFKV